MTGGLLDFLPVFLTIGFALAFPSAAAKSMPARIIVFCATGLLAIRYGIWRWNDSMIYAEGAEAWIAGVYLIPTYNEPIDVVERSILGALAISWPKDKIKIWVCDDGKREWLEKYCTARGVGYLTREDNLHAKAGNINAALNKTGEEFVAVFDADFIAQPSFLMRTVGWMDDPRIGIVQAPHHFFNKDPLQSLPSMRGALPGEQRFFFDDIMPGRDGWDCAFCCGSNSLTRRSSFEAIGGMPTGSVTEDQLLTLSLLRHGMITRYVNERLAVGLAPESIEGFFIQRERWGRGALQMLYLKDGPLGPGLSFFQRIAFLSTYWIGSGLLMAAGLILPLVYLWFGLSPMPDVAVRDFAVHFLPACIAIFAALRFAAPENFFPFGNVVVGVLQAFWILPTTIGTLFQPFGHKFRLTPKGSDARVGGAIDPRTLWISVSFMVAPALGIIINLDSATRIVPHVGGTMVMALWSLGIALILVSAIACTSIPTPDRTEERFPKKTEVAVIGASGKNLPQSWATRHRAERCCILWKISPPQMTSSQ